MGKNIHLYLKLTKLLSKSFNYIYKKKMSIWFILSPWFGWVAHSQSKIETSIIKLGSTETHFHINNKIKLWNNIFLLCFAHAKSERPLFSKSKSKWKAENDFEGLKHYLNWIQVSLFQVLKIEPYRSRVILNFSMECLW